MDGRTKLQLTHLIDTAKGHGSALVNRIGQTARAVDPGPEFDTLTSVAAMRAPRTAELPPLRPDGALPVGIHDVDLGSFLLRTGTTPERRELLRPFARSVLEMQQRGVREVFAGGSMVGAKPTPGDVDALVHGSDAGKIGALRTANDWLHGIHWHTAESPHVLARRAEGEPAPTWLEYFQRNTKPGAVGESRRGVARIVLADAPATGQARSGVGELGSGAAG